MSGIFRCGFGMNSVTVGHEWATGTSGSPVIETTTTRSNGKALRITPTAAENVSHLFQTSQDVTFHRIYFRLAASATNDGRSIMYFANSATIKLDVRVRDSANNNKLRLWNVEDSAQVGSDSGNISLNTWYRLEVKIDSTTLSSIALEARLYTDAAPDDLIWNPSGTVDLTADPNRVLLGSGSSDATLDVIYDDWGINNDAGSFQNSWLGPGRCTIMRPDGDSAVAWARGGTDSGANWSQVEEAPPNDITDYVQSNTNNQVDDYTLEAAPSAIDSTDVINGIFPGVRFRISSTTGSDPDFVLRVTSGGNTDETGNLSGAGTTTWNTNTIADPRIYPALANDSNYQIPGGSSSYTKSTLDSLILGIRETATDTHFAQVSAVWLYVDHTPVHPTDQQPAFLKGQDTITDQQPAYLNGEAAGTAISDQQPAYLKGQDTSTDQQPAYLKGQDTSTDQQPAYLYGVEIATDQQPAYLKGTDTHTDQQPAYLKGADTSTDQQPAYLKGQDTATDQQPAYLRGTDTSTDQKPAYLKGQDTSTDQQPAYLRGADTSTDQQPAYLKGQDTATDQQPAYLNGVAGGAEISDQQPAYLKGQDTHTDQQPAYLKGQDTSTDNQPAYLKGQDTSADNQPAYLKGQDTATDNQPAYLKGQDTSIDQQPAYLAGSASITDSQPAYLEGSSVSTASASLSAYMLGSGTIEIEVPGQIYDSWDNEEPGQPNIAEFQGEDESDFVPQPIIKEYQGSNVIQDPWRAE